MIVFATLRNSLCAPRAKTQLLALLGGVDLDDPDAAERLGETSGDFGVDRAALAEDRPQALEGGRHHAAERSRATTSVTLGELPVEVEENAERDARAVRIAADELHEPGADEIPDALGIAHDRARSARRSSSSRSSGPAGACTCACTRLRISVIARCAAMLDDLRERERGERLHEGRAPAAIASERHQESAGAFR